MHWILPGGLPADGSEVGSSGPGVSVGCSSEGSGSGSGSAGVEGCDVGVRIGVVGSTLGRVAVGEAGSVVVDVVVALGVGERLTA